MKYGSKNVRSLYYSLPLTAKNLFASAYGWNERRGRYGKSYRQSLSMLRKSQYWPNEKLLEYQHQGVLRFLPDVIRKTSYYRSHDTYVDLLKANAPLNAFPLLAKTTLRREPKNFYHDEL